MAIMNNKKLMVKEGVFFKFLIKKLPLYFFVSSCYGGAEQRHVPQP